MEQYISKSALVAEIESLKADALQKKSQCKRSGLERIMHQIGAYNKILSFLDTLEVKEVDWEHLEQEVQDFCERFDDRKESWYNMTPHDQKLMVSPTFANFAMQIAKHFFEIGMRSTITEEDCKLIWNIGDGLPCMKEEDFFKELLRRYKAQKGEQL